MSDFRRPRVLTHRGDYSPPPRRTSIDSGRESSDSIDGSPRTTVETPSRGPFIEPPPPPPQIESESEFETASEIETETETEVESEVEPEVEQDRGNATPRGINIPRFLHAGRGVRMNPKKAESLAKEGRLKEVYERLDRGRKSLGISRHAPPQPRGRDMPQVSSDVGDHPNNRVIRDMALLNGGAYRKLLPPTQYVLWSQDQRERLVLKEEYQEWYEHPDTLPFQHTYGANSEWIGEYVPRPRKVTRTEYLDRGYLDGDDGLKYKYWRSWYGSEFKGDPDEEDVVISPRHFTRGNHNKTILVPKDIDDYLVLGSVWVKHPQDSWHTDGYESARARSTGAQFGQETAQLVGHVIQDHDSTSHCLDRKPWAYSCGSETCTPCHFYALNLCGVVKAYGVGLVGIRAVQHFPFLTPADRLNLLNSTGGVVEPKWIDLGVLTQEDQGKILPQTKIVLTRF